MRPVHTTPTGAKIYFAQGKFDDWCVYIEKPGATAYGPTDIEYFTFLRAVSAATSVDAVYGSFKKVYAGTTKALDPAIIKLIAEEAKGYGAHAADMEAWLAVLYAAMIAEENKERAILKKRIKHLGLYQVLFQKMEPAVAANWSKGKGWREIAAECAKYGF